MCNLGLAPYKGNTSIILLYISNIYRPHKGNLDVYHQLIEEFNTTLVSLEKVIKNVS